MKFLNAYSAENGDFKVPKIWSLIVSFVIPFQIFLLFMWWFEEAARNSSARKWYKVNEVNTTNLSSAVEKEDLNSTVNLVQG